MKTYIAPVVIFILLLSIIIPISVSADNILTISDGSNDVLDKDANEISYPNLDISQVSVDSTNNQVDLSLTLIQGGKILDSGFVVAYSIYLTTNVNIYEAMYSYSETDLSDIGLSGTGVLVTAYKNDDYEQGTEVNVKSYSGIGDNELVISFDLLNSYEKCITIEGITMFLSDLAGTQTYIDELTVDSTDFPTVEAGGTYYINAKDKVTLEGSIESGNPANYNWLWTIDDTSVTKETQTAQHTFLIPGTYSGKLYVYDNQGRYREDSFTVQVNSTSSNNGNNGDNNEPGFEAIAVIFAIAIALIILRKRRQ